MKLLVLAGGFGTRLNAVLPNLPKALAPVGEVAFLTLQMENWIWQGVTSFVFLLHHQADQIIAHLDELRAGVLKDYEVVTIVEPVPLDTGGAVAYATRELGLKGEFLVTNADTWLSTGFQKLSELPAPAMAIVQVKDGDRFGQVKLDGDQNVTAFVEKAGDSGPGWINAGLYRLDATMFEDWDGNRFSLEKQTLASLVTHRALKAVCIEADFIDIGIPQDYQRFCRWIKEGRKGRLCS